MANGVFLKYYVLAENKSLNLFAQYIGLRAFNVI